MQGRDNDGRTHAHCRLLRPLATNHRADHEAATVQLYGLVAKLPKSLGRIQKITLETAAEDLRGRPTTAARLQESTPRVSGIVGTCPLRGWPLRTSTEARQAAAVVSSSHADRRSAPALGRGEHPARRKAAAEEGEEDHELAVEEESKSKRRR